MGDGLGAPEREPSSYIVDEKEQGPSGVTNSPIICSLPSFRFPTPIFDDPLIWPPVHCSWLFVDWLRDCHSLFSCLQFCEATHCSLFFAFVFVVVFSRLWRGPTLSRPNMLSSRSLFFTSRISCTFIFLPSSSFPRGFIPTVHRCRLHVLVSVVSVI